MNRDHERELDSALPDDLPVQTRHGDIPSEGAMTPAAADAQPDDGGCEDADGEFTDEAAVVLPPDTEQPASEPAMPVPVRSVHVDVAPPEAAGPVAQPRFESLPVDKLDKRFQCRSLNSKVVENYLEVLSWGRQLPQIRVVRYDRGNGDVVYYLVDGAHRLAARAARGERIVVCEVVDGDEGTALWEMAGSNTKHGLARTDEDKQRQAQMLFSDPELRKKSDRSIADQMHVSPTFVGKERAKFLKANGILPGQDGKRVASDGRLFGTKVPKSTFPRVAAMEPPAPDDSATRVDVPTPDEPDPGQLDGNAQLNVENIETQNNASTSAKPRSRWEPVDADLVPRNRPVVVVAALPIGNVRDGTQSQTESNRAWGTDEPYRALEGPRFRIPFVTQSGDAAEDVYDFNNPEAGLRQELVVLRPFMRNVATLGAAQVPEAVLVALLRYAMKAA